MPVLDEKDKKILEILEKNSRLSYIQIGKKIKLSEGAVRRRIKQLIKKNIIKKFTIETGIGKINAVMLIKVNPKTPTKRIYKKVQLMKNIKSVYEVTGEYDIIVFLQSNDINTINDTVEKIRRVGAVIESKTCIALK